MHKVYPIFIMIITLAITANGYSQSAFYDYYDGSGNGYSIRETYIEYSPVIDLHSSSGSYSGGKPVKKEITETQHATIKQLIERSIKQKDQHQDKREMATGMIRVSDGQHSTTYILKPGCESMKAIENWLKDVMGTK